MNSRLELFNKQLETCGLDAYVGTTKCPVLIKDIDNKGLIETKHIYVPNDVKVAIGDTITLMDKKYIVLNISLNSVFNDVLVQETYHSIKVKYSWLPLMQFDIIPTVQTQTMIDTTYLVAEKTTIEVQLQRNTLSKQIKKGTRFFVFDIPCKVTSITYENSNILSLKCDIDGINPNDDVINQIADNSQLTPPTPKYTITSSAGVNGSITPLGEVVVEKGKSQVFAITCNEGYEIDTVLVDGVEVELSGLSYTFSNVEADHTISVSFKEVMVIALSITGDAYLYKGWNSEPYYLNDGNGTHMAGVTWSVDKSWCTVTQDGTSCTLKFDSLSYVNETIVLTATYNENTYTKTVKTQS